VEMGDFGVHDGFGFPRSKPGLWSRYPPKVESGCLYPAEIRRGGKGEQSSRSRTARVRERVSAGSPSVPFAMRVAGPALERWAEGVILILGMGWPHSKIGMTRPVGGFTMM
jgi:hypothetical protein